MASEIFSAGDHSIRACQAGHRQRVSDYLAGLCMHGSRHFETSCLGGLDVTYLQDPRRHLVTAISRLTVPRDTAYLCGVNQNVP